MTSVKSIVQEYLKDTLYESRVVMRSDRSKKLTIIMDNLRGVCGITVITLEEPARSVSPSVEKTYLKVKFFKLEPTLEEHLTRMSREARKIDGVYSFLPYKTSKSLSKIYIK
tara:strand:+ start:80 stop:415 length:336 start_codon:yes stop_codon:yes gene_type:complete